MKILKEDQNLMILKDNNITIFVVGIIFVFVGLMIIFKPDYFTNETPLWFGFVGILFGLFIILMAKITTISLDKLSNKLSFQQKGLTNKIIKEYTLGQIKEIELSVSYSTSGKNNYSYHLAFVLNNNEIIPLNPGSSSFLKIMGKQIIPENTIGQRIANFLNVPFQNRQPPTASEALSTISSAIQNAIEKEKTKKDH